MMVEESIKEEASESDSYHSQEDNNSFDLDTISLEDLKQRFLDLRQYTTSKEQEVEVLQSIIVNKDEQIVKQQEMIDLMQK